MSKVSNMGEKVEYCCGKNNIGMSVYIDGIAAGGGIPQIKKGIRNCAFFA